MQELLKQFDEKFLYWVVLGSTLNDGSELRWNVGDDQMPSIKEVKKFLLSAYTLGIEEGRSEERQFILNTLNGIDVADEQMQNKGGGTKAIRLALASRPVLTTKNK